MLTSTWAGGRKPFLTPSQRFIEELALGFAFGNKAQATRVKADYLAHGHIIPDLGARKLRDLSAQDVDRWLTAKAKTLSSSTLASLHSLLNRTIKRAMARDYVKRVEELLTMRPQP